MNIRDRLEKISSAEEKTDVLYSVFNSINGNSLPIIRFNIKKGAFVIRQRLNLTGSVFSSISELSYPPISCCKDYGRANIPFHPVFYCSFFPDDPNAPIPRYITLLETSSFAADVNTIGIERSTCSKWDIVEQLNLIALPFSDNYKDTITDIEEIKEGWKKVKAQDEINKDALELVEYMSNEISKKTEDNKEYFKIANFVHYLLHVNSTTKDADGIVYPSVAAAGKGFNMALKTEAVDNKLKFTTASLCFLIKDKLSAELKIKNHSVGQNDDGTIIFEERFIDENSLKGLPFIN